MTEKSQASKSCMHCGFGNPAVAKFCSECGERFGVARVPGSALDSGTNSSTNQGTTSPQPIDPRAAFEQFVLSTTPEDATCRLRSSIEISRGRLKTMGVPLPKATNPILVSLMESLKALPRNEISARIAIVTALGRMGDPAVLPPLLLVTGAQSKDVRKATAIALGCIRHPLSAYLLLPLMQDGSSRVRQTAFQALIQLNQPHTMEAILAACLGSRSFRSLILETLRLITGSKRNSFFQLLNESDADQQPDLRIVADWLRFEFRDAITQSRAAQTANTAAVAPEPAPAALPQNARLQQAKPVRQPVAVAADSQSSESSIFGWGDGEVIQPATAGRAASAHRYSTRATAATAKESQTADRYEMTSEGDDDYESDVRLVDDDYESDVRLADDGDGSAADLKFFNSISESIPDSDYYYDDDHSELEFASSGSQAVMSLSGMLAAPETSQQSSGQMTRPAAQSSNNGDRPFTLRGHSEQGASKPTPLSSQYSAYDTATLMGNTPGVSMPLMPMIHPAAKLADGTIPPANRSGRMSATSAFDMAASSPLIPAFHSSAAQPFTFTATTSNAGNAGPEITSTVGKSSTASGVTSIVLPDDDQQSIAEIEAARAIARSAHEKALARLSAAREEAFRRLLEDAAEIPKTLPRHLRKRVSALIATPATNMDRIIEQLHDLGATNSPAALSTLASFCQKPAKQVREACAEAIGCIAHPGSAVLLLKLLADKSGTVVEAAIKSLGKLDLEPTRPVLFAAGLCGASLRTVVTLGVESTADEKKPEWEKLLLEVLRADDANSAAFAVSLLSRIAGDTHLEIFQKLATHKAPVLRAAAVEALSRTQAKRAISQINDAMEDEDPAVRAQAAMSVATMYSPRSVELLQKLVFDSNLNVRRNAAQSMSRIDESDLADVIARALEQETDATTVEYLLAALQRNGANSSLPILQRYVEGDSSQFRELAVKALRKLKIPASVPVFRRLLDDDTPALRRHAIEQLAVLKPEGVLPRLREMLKKDPDAMVRSASAKALGDFGDETSVHLLEEALEDHPLVRLQTVIALGRLGQASAGPILLSLMRDQLPEVRYQAVRAVAQLKLAGVEEQIGALLEDSDEMVRRGAEQSLQDLGQGIGTIRSKRLRKRFLSLASRLTPSSVAGAIPGGSKSLLIVLLLLFAAGGYWSISTISFFAGGGEALPVGWIVALDVNAETKVAAALREDAVLDIWSIENSELVTRVSVPESTQGVLAEPKGGVILLMGNELGRLDPESEFSPKNLVKVELPGVPSAFTFHDASDSLCLFYKSDSVTTLRILDSVSLQETRSFKINGPFEGSCTVSPDFSVAVMLDGAGLLKLADLKSGEIVTAPVNNLLGPDTKLGRVYSVAFTGDMKHFVFCATGGCAIMDAGNLQLVRTIDSPDNYGFISAKAIDSGSDFVLLSASGSVYSITDKFKNVMDSRIERDDSFDLAAISSGGELVAVANTEGYDFDVYSVLEKRTLMTSTQ